MSRWTRAVAGALGVLLSLSMLASPVQARPRNIFEQMFNPPPGMQLTTERPRNGLQLRTGKVKLHPRFMRQVVAFHSDQPAGTIIVNTGEKHLYLVLGKGKALRYGIGTARDGFEWSGTHRVTNKREWPGWTPPAEMKKRQPGLPDYMPGGVNNPLGARALYIGSTLYRIHGTNEPWTIGTNVSSGCIRMVNEDVIDLYERVKIGAKVIVL
jgi:lipoprotein-anchoring transpeptidase ErfK/SrfK